MRPVRNSRLPLLLFVLLLAPGLTYRVYRAPTVSVQKLSGLREVGGVALRSCAFDGIALGVFGLLRTFFPRSTPDIGALVRDHDAYLRREYVLVMWWSIAALTFACILAVVGAHFVGSNTARVWKRSTKLRWVLPRGTITDDPAWKIILEAHRDKRTFVGLVLTDGHYIDGFLSTSSADAEETADRDIALLRPLRLREPGHTDLNDLLADAVIISAHSINYMTVSYLDIE